MRIGLSVIFAETDYGRWGEERYNKLKEHGFSCIDYDICNTNLPLYSMSETEAKNYLDKEKELAKKAGITFHQMHGPWRYPPRDLETEDREERLEKMKKSIEFCAYLGCKYWVVHPIMPYGLSDIDEGNSQKTWDLNMSFMKELLEFSKKLDVTICLENMPFDHFSLATPEKILKFVREINDEHFKACLDTGHVLLFPHLNVPDEVRRLGKYIKVFHIHDNNGLSDEHRPPFSGIIDWTDFKKALDEIEFDGVFSLETLPIKTLSDSAYEERCIIFHKLAEEVINL